jgi:glycosyltransferase involved in cell wall biosynthesis
MALSLFRRQPYDAIYATGFPWTSLIIGRDVAAATGRPLIADFRDPWAGEDLFRDHRPPREEEARLERSVVTRADAVVTVSDTMTRRMRAAYPEIDEAKFQTIENGFDQEDLELAPGAPANGGKFRIVFTGVWKDGYNPAPLYDVIDWLRRSRPHVLEGVEVVAAGFAPGEAVRRGLSAYIKEAGVLPHRDAVALMHSADALFLTNGDGARQQLAIPVKMYEYLATGRPVIALTHPDGDAAKVLRLVGGGIAVPPDDPGALFDLMAASCGSRTVATPPLNRAALAAYERSNLTRRLADVLDAATVRAPLRAGTPAPHEAPALLRWRPR